mmetsp:Transcript_28741/g.41145  ORF Transcript_28741/g.41145 Transcript_28741/m.41145 type:complete len:88 (-) Transcript_28741:245-508(-)
MFPVGSSEAVNLCDYMHRDFLGDHAQPPDIASFPSTSRFRVPQERYGDGLKSVGKLRKDLVTAAKQSSANSTNIDGHKATQKKIGGW